MDKEQVQAMTQEERIHWLSERAREGIEAKEQLLVANALIEAYQGELVKAHKLIGELAAALNDHHLGMSTTRPFEATYMRDGRLLERARKVVKG